MEPACAEPVASSPPGAQARSAAVWLMAGAVIGFPVMGLWLVPALVPGELIRPVSPDLFAAAIFAGVFAGSYSLREW